MLSNLVGNTELSVKRETWLLSSCVGTGSSARLALGEGRSHGLLPCAGAAAKLSSVSGKTFVDAVKLMPEAISGEAFCFLPLSYATGFPVHVNGYFAITSNRRGIWERSTSDQYLPIEVEWNENLMEDALTRAYVQLLLEVKRFLEEDSVQLHRSYDKLWPCYKTLKSSTWETLVKSVYTKIVEEALPLFWSNDKWLDIHSGYILDEDLRKAPGALEVLNHLEEDVFHLTPEVRYSLVKSGQTETLQNRTLTLENFFMKFFFPNITKMPQNLRDPIVWFGLDRILSQEETFASLFKENACITCSEDGVHLAKPCELVSPRGAAANLFSIEDRRFPVGEAFSTDNRLYVLEKLGMAKDKLSWYEICGRAKSVGKLAEISYRRGLQRVKNLIKYLKENIEILEQEETADKDILEVFQGTRFMPFVWKPFHEYTLPWKGSQLAPKQFFAPKDLFLPVDVDLVGSCCLIVDDSDRSGCGKFGERVKGLLGFGERRPSNDQVLQQLDIAVSENTKKGHKPKQSLTESVCKKVYKHLNAFVKEATDQPAVENLINIKLREKSWLYIQGRFVSIDKVAFNWKGIGAPYLHGLSDEYRSKYGSLLRAAGVKEFFVAMDFINALLTLSELKKGTALDKDEMKLTLSFVNELKDVEADVVGKVPLPDSGGVLYKSEELTINETFWLQDRGDACYVHDDIPPKLALDLGAKLLLDRRRKKYANVFYMPFGQYERLTDRIKNILKAYPCDSGILKELVQNADDAKATEIHFVYDTRVLPHERVFQLNAEMIQGPALCVYNDRPFSDKDLEGIQNLGIGSKADDLEKAGQYGIGFNAVYHLTDCPSFISDGETLCLLDPHCRYAPEATLKRPGGKFGPINDEFKEDFSDTLCGYLGEHFKLKGSTMFRFPLRTAQCDSLISNDEVSDSKIRGLFSIFRKEAKKMLLFLSHVKKIALSVLDSEGDFKEEYQVVSSVDEEHEGKRRAMTSLIKEYKERPTHEIPWKGVTYSMTLSDSTRVVEKWLIHQCCGNTLHEEDNAIPDGRPLGLFPRGGIAALVSSTSSVQREYIAYCFLPLPVKTSLPVHINGHFALNTSRRDLWTDADYKGPLTKWNDFMKTRVLAPGYAALITEARNYIPHCKRGPNNQYCFQNQTDAETGLKWYHDIFPNPSKDSAWRILAVEVYRCLGSKEEPVLPVVGFADERRQVDAVFDRNIRDPFLVSQPREIKSRATSIARSSLTRAARGRFGKVVTTFNGQQTTKCRARLSYGRTRVKTKTALKSARTSQITHSKTGRGFSVSLRRCGSFIHVPLTQIIKWLPVHQAFFVEKSQTNDIWETFLVFLRIDMPVLLFSPYRIYAEFRKSGAKPCLVNPRSVIDFLLTSQSSSPRCKIGKLPSALNTTNIGSQSGLHRLISYCKQEKQFPGLLESLPLLLTADKQLRSFDSSKPVYRSKFSDLFPTKADMFVHPEFVDELPGVSRQQDDEEPLPQVMRDLTVSALALFFPDVFPPELKGCTKHVPWTFAKSGVLSETWFKRLWVFLEKHAKPEQNTAKLSLGSLGEWPIIPTSCGKLVTINNAKSVLDMSEGKTKYGFVAKIQEILKRLDCPTLREDITKSCLVHPELYERPLVLDAYVAHPDRAVDVLQVLAYMNTTGELHTTKFKVEDIRDLLKYFQDDKKACENHIKILKDLPFYKATDDGLYALSGYFSYVTVPCDIPTTEMKKLQDCLGKRCLLLHPDPLLHRLYKMLGVETTSDLCEFYKNYVLRYFDIFSRKCQIEYLSHIKDSLAFSSNQKFLTFLQSIPCIPNKAGDLYYASDFYPRNNEVYNVMLDPNSNQFLSAPFNETDWLMFLIKIGLEQDVSQNQFLEFCRKVEKDAATSEDDEINRKRSKVLVRYLFDKNHLHKPNFLTSVSSIQFIAPENVEDELLSLHKQHQYDETKKKLQYVRFDNSVPWKCRHLVWTSFQLLPEWAQPSSLSGKAQCLRVQEKPSIESVMTHLETICNAHAEMGKKEEVLPNFDKLKYVMVSIYKFLDQNKECDGKELSNSCSSACREIGHRMTSVPCVLLEDEKALVEGEKLSFTVPPDRSLKPFFHTVPREYGVYQHLLKRLGATEVVTSFQMANVLKAIRDDCEGGKISTKYEKMVCDAMFLLFQSVITDADKKASKIPELTEFYLPSEAQLLVRSNELVCHVPPRLVQVVARQEYHVLFPLERCGLKRGREGEYLGAIPERLRPKSLDTLVCEVLNPACRNETCSYFDAESCCTFIEKYIVLLKSTQLRQGLVRLMKHQKKMNELPSEEKEKAARFSSGKVEIKCMKTIETHLVYVKDRTPLENSSSERTCYVTRESDSWTLYIQHEFGGTHTKAILGKAVREIIEDCVEDTSELADILSCDTPSRIPGVLDVHDVSRDFSEEEEELGQEISVVFHYLMLQNPMCLFEEGALVAYGIETTVVEGGTDTLEDDTTRYILAKIIKRIGKLGVIGKAYDFQAEYCIDVGSETKMVSVLDLYKFQEGNLMNSTEAFEDNSSFINVNEEKHQIRKALWEAKRLLPSHKQLKVLRRLYLHWIRASSSGNAEAATEIIELLLAEAKNIIEEMAAKDGPRYSRNFYRRFRMTWDRQETRLREAYNNFRQSYVGQLPRFCDTSDYVSPEPKEASRWIEQSLADLKVASFLYSNVFPFYAMVCFMSEQVAEKCLKAALYAKCGLGQEQLHTHDVRRLARAVSYLRESPKDAVSRADSVANYYLPTRYPNRQPRFRVPANEFSKEDAEKALEAARELLEGIKTFISG